MIQIHEIIRTLDEEIERQNSNFLTPPEANKILDSKGLLSDSKNRAGSPLRKLLRNGLLPHAYQVGTHWRIPHSKKESENTFEIPSNKKNENENTSNNKDKPGLKTFHFKGILTLIIFIIIIGAFISFFTNKEKNTHERSENRTDNNRDLEKNLPNDYSTETILPAVQLAIIYEKVSPPSKEAVKRFSLFFEKVQKTYPSLSNQEIADMTSKAFQLAVESGYDETFLQFVNGLDIALDGFHDMDRKENFASLLALYVKLLFAQ